MTKGHWEVCDISLFMGFTKIFLDVLGFETQKSFDLGRIQKPHLLEIQLLTQLLDQKFLSCIFGIGFSDFVAS